MDMNFGVTLLNPLQLSQLEKPVPTASLCFMHQTQQVGISSRALYSCPYYSIREEEEADRAHRWQLLGEIKLSHLKIYLELNMHAEGEKMGGIKGNSDGQEGHLGGPGQPGGSGQHMNTGARAELERLARARSQQNLPATPKTSVLFKNQLGVTKGC